MIEQQYQRTNENWTWGIINIPLLYGHNNRLGVTPKTIIRKVAHNARCYSKPYYALDKSKRYLWFENDVAGNTLHEEVLSFYRDMGIDVYWHCTMKGYHYITLHLMPRNQYEALVERMKEKFNNGTFFYSLRIIPNKWKFEDRLWRRGDIETNGSGDWNKLIYIQSALEQPYTPSFGRIPPTVQMLDNMFCISRYQFKNALQV